MTGRILEKTWTTVAADLMHFPGSSSKNKYFNFSRFVYKVDRVETYQG